MYDEQHLTHDAAVVTFHDDCSGVTTDDDGDVSIDWNDVETVTIDNPPHAEAFDTREFYRMRATVARPIPQPYKFNDSIVWLKKPRSELKKAAWSLDNRPWTLEHPDTGMVSDVDDVRGFWNDTQYFDAVDDLDSYLHFPVGDDEAKEFIEGNSDVSVGFRNRISRVDDYDGIVGGEDASEDELDGYQTDMLFDHCASVGRGRCTSEQGCGIDAGAEHGTMTNIDTDINITNVSEDSNETTDAKNTHEGKWYAVPPEDNPDDEWKFPINNCNDAKDAWNLRTQGDISISVETLEDRIKRRASDLGCELPSTAESDSMHDESTTNMTEDCECNDGGLGISFDDLSADVALDKLANDYESIDAHLSDLRVKAQVAEDAAEELDVDIEQVAKKAGMLDETVDDLRQKVDELQTPQMEDAAAFIAERTDRFGETAEDVIEQHDSLEDLESTKELVEDLTEQTDSKTANATQTTDSSGNGMDVELDRRGYVKFD